MKTKYQGIVKDRMEVSYVYDPVGKTLECSVEYNGAKDSFCCMFDEYLTCKTVHEHVNGFVQYLLLKMEERE